MCYFGILWIIKGLNTIVKETYNVRAILIYMVYQPAAILTVRTLNLFCGTYTYNYTEFRNKNGLRQDSNFLMISYYYLT